MQKPILVISILGAFVMAVIYNEIKKVTGIEIDLLLYAALAIMVVGLCFGLCSNNKDKVKEEA